MKILKEIKLMYKLLPEKEKQIFTNIFGPNNQLNLLDHQTKQIVYNLLLWRTDQRGGPDRTDRALVLQAPNIE